VQSSWKVTRGMQQDGALLTDLHRMRIEMEAAVRSPEQAVATASGHRPSTASVAADRRGSPPELRAPAAALLVHPAEPV